MIIASIFYSSIGLLQPISFTSNPIYELKEISFENGIYKFNDRPINGEIVDYHENGQIKFKYAVLAGRFHQEAIEFYPDGQMKAKRNYVFGKLFGSYQIFFPDGSKRLSMLVDRNRYGEGEMINELYMAKKPNRKLKAYGAAYLLFVDEKNRPMKNSNDLPIHEQAQFYIIQEGQIAYVN